MVTLKAGDTLFIPEGWWHQVDSSPVTLAVNYWWPSLLTRQLQAVPHMTCYYLRSLAAAVTAEGVQTLLEAGVGSDIRQQQQQQQQEHDQEQQKQQQQVVVVQQQPQEQLLSGKKPHHQQHYQPHHHQQQQQESEEEQSSQGKVAAPPHKKLKTTGVSTPPAGTPSLPLPVDTSTAPARSWVHSKHPAVPAALSCLRPQEAEVLQQLLGLVKGASGVVRAGTAAAPLSAGVTGNAMDLAEQVLGNRNMAGTAAAAGTVATGGGLHIAPGGYALSQVQQQQHSNSECTCAAYDLWPAELQQQHQAAAKQLLLSLLSAPGPTANGQHVAPAPAAAPVSGQSQHHPQQSAAPGSPQGPPGIQGIATPGPCAATPTGCLGEAATFQNCSLAWAAGSLGRTDMVRGLGLEDGFTRALQALSAEGVIKVMYVLAVEWPAVARELLLRRMSPAAAQVLTQKLEQAEQMFEAVEHKECLMGIQQAETGKGQKVAVLMGSAFDQECAEGPCGGESGTAGLGVEQLQAARGFSDGTGLGEPSGDTHKISQQQREKCSSLKEQQLQEQEQPGARAGGLEMPHDGKQDKGVVDKHGTFPDPQKLPYRSKEEFYSRLYGCVEDPGELFQLMLSGKEVLAAAVKRAVLAGCGLL